MSEGSVDFLASLAAQIPVVALFALMVLRLERSASGQIALMMTSFEKLHKGTLEHFEKLLATCVEKKT